MQKPEKPSNWKTELKNKPALFKLIQDKKIRDLVIDFNQKYYPWDKIKREQLPNNVSAKEIWALMKLFRTDKYEYLKFDSLDLTYTLLSSILKKLHELDKYSTGNISSDNSFFLNKQDETKYIISSLMEEAIASSQLEGAATTRKIAKEMLKQNRNPRTYDEQMIVNGYKTLRLIIDSKQEKLTPEFILEVQKTITSKTLKNSKYEGRFRDNNDVVVADPIELEKIYHFPPDFNNIPNLVDKICQFANNDEKFIHPIIKAIILHFLIGYVHPFNDGNGRTARALFYWYVLSKDYWLFEYMAISRKILQSKTDYAKAYLHTEIDEFDLTYFINYNIKVICNAMEDMQEYIKRKQKEQKEAYQLISKVKDISLRQAGILKDLIKDSTNPITIASVKENFKVVYQTARADLLDLAEKGYLTRNIGKKKLFFFFTEENRKNLYSNFDKKD